MYSLPNLEPVHCFMTDSNCCFLTCMWISQEAGKVVWYSHLFKNFPVCCNPQSKALAKSMKKIFSRTLLLFSTADLELHRLSNNHVFFKSKYYTTTQPALGESMDVELQIQGEESYI